MANQKIVNGLEEARETLFALLGQGVFPLKVVLDSDCSDLEDIVEFLISLDKEYHCWPPNFEYVVLGSNLERGYQLGMNIDMHMIKTGRIIPN